MSSTSTGILEAGGIIISMVAHGEVYDNLFVEHLWLSLKDGGAISGSTQRCERLDGSWETISDSTTSRVSTRLWGTTHCTSYMRALGPGPYP